MLKFREKFKVTKDACGDQVILGKWGQIEEHGNGLLSIWVVPKDRKMEYSKRKLGSLFKKLTPYLTHTLLLTGEGSGLFMEENIDGVALALGIRKRRKATDVQKQHLALIRRK